MRHNGTPAATVSQFISDLFEDYSDERLIDLIHAGNHYSLKPDLPVLLADAADLAGRLAEAALEARDEVRREVEAAYRRERDAFYAQQAETAAANAEALADYRAAVTAGQQPF